MFKKTANYSKLVTLKDVVAMDKEKKILSNWWISDSKIRNYS